MEREMNPDFYISRSEMAEEYYEMSARAEMDLQDIFLAQMNARAERLEEELQADPIIV